MSEWLVAAIAFPLGAVFAYVGYRRRQRVWRDLLLRNREVYDQLLKDATKGQADDT